ncbi:MAG TPA: WD40 repeat domain-containing protein [Tepidisphaeraceae bacterium]|nr:WD40 repeat domain-containing protein [Tepidisphaeraceae bacterium]
MAQKKSPADVNELGRLVMPLKRDSFESAWSPDGKRVATARGRIWDLPARNLAMELEKRSNCSNVAWSPDGHRIANLDTSGRIWLFDADSGSRVAEIATGAEGYGVAFSPDGRELVAGNWNGNIGRWSASDGKVIDTIALRGWMVHDVWYRTAGAIGMSVLERGVGVHHVEWENGAANEKWLLPPDCERLVPVDMKHAMTWAADEAILLNLSNGKIVHRMRLGKAEKGTTIRVKLVVPSPAGNLFAAIVSTDFKSKQYIPSIDAFVVFDQKSIKGRYVTEYANHVAFSPDGGMLALSTWHAGEIREMTPN